MNYKELKEELRAKNRANDTDGKAPRSASKTELYTMAHTFINDTDYVQTEYSPKAKDEKGKPVKMESNPVKEYRESLKPTLKALGLDNTDVDKINDVQFNKKHAAALVDVATAVIKDHISSGRKLVLPMTETTECQMAFSASQYPEKVVVGNRFAKTEEDANKTTTTAARDVLKAKNTVPSWLKTVK